MMQVRASSVANAPENKNNNISNNLPAECLTADSDDIYDKQDTNLRNADTRKNDKTALKRKSYKINHNEEEYSGCNDGNATGKSTREKTPMCLVNDLARYNKISFQYRLTGEKGPAHCKQFTVTLELGEEEYTAEGYKIKKAQHLAAKDAMQRTKYKHPVPKLNRRNDDQGTSRANITPTVELNALAMKLGQQTYYIFDPRQMSTAENNSGTMENIQQPRYKVNRVVGSNGMKSILASDQTKLQNNLSLSGTFIPSVTSNPAIIRVHPGGYNRTQFQHCYPVVATPQHLSSTLFPSCRITLIVGTQKFYGIGKTIQQAKHDAAAQAIVKLRQHLACQQSETVAEKLNENYHKSPISFVFEIGIKRNMPVDFKILREDGPAHMRKFITACIVGDIVTEGEGTGKKVSKKKAAQKMIEELNKLPPVSPVISQMKRVKSKTQTKRNLTSPLKNKNISQIQKLSTEKCQKSDSDFDNPVAKVLEWCQNSNYSEPVFKIISDKGKDKSRRGQYVVDVTSNECTAQGFGNSKKLAKRNAAQNFLISFGSAATEKPSSSDVDTIPTESRPVIVRNHEKDDTNRKQCDPLPSSNAVIKGSGFYMKDKLLYLARLIGFEVDFSDYPKGNHNEFLTILMISTNPPQICHGVGINSEESQEDASKNALKILSEMGINNSMN